MNVVSVSRRISAPALLALLALLTAVSLPACGGGDEKTAEPTTAASATVPVAPTTAASSTVAPVTATAPPTTNPTGEPSTSTTSTIITIPPATMPPMPVGERVAFSLPPNFAAVGVDVPVVVSVDVEPVGIDVVDASGSVLTSLSPSSSQFWMGSIPGAAVTGTELKITPVARSADGENIEGPTVSVVVFPSNGSTIDRREVDAETNVVYDRPWSSAPGELDWISSEGEGVSTNPPGLARVDDDEVAVLDIAASRVTCFNLAGESTCTVPLPISASGDMFALGDGTLAVIDLGNRDGHQEFHVLRVDPHAELAEVIYHEYPLEVAGYPGIATNTGFHWDPPSRTAWVGIPEADSPPAPDEPNSARFPLTDALHLDPDDITRGPTVQRPALRPDAAMSRPGSYRLLDGNAWVTLYDTPAPYYSTLGTEATESGVIWLLMAIGNSGGGRGTTELVRWRPGDTYFEAFPIDFGIGENLTRRIAALDDNTVAVLDLNIGGRIRAFTFPPLAANDRP